MILVLLLEGSGENIGCSVALLSASRLRPSKDELNICNIFKLQIYLQFHLSHCESVQTSKSRYVSNHLQSLVKSTF